MSNLVNLTDMDLIILTREQWTKDADKQVDIQEACGELVTQVFNEAAANGGEDWVDDLLKNDAWVEAARVMNWDENFLNSGDLSVLGFDN